MSDTTNNVRDTVRKYLLDELLPGEDSGNLEDTTPLVSERILDSIMILKLVTFLEETFDIEFEAHEMTVDHLDTILDMVEIVQTKMNRGK